MKKSYIIAVLVFCIGTVMLFGSSYSLITNLNSEDIYEFNITDFDKSFLDSTNISVTSLSNNVKELEVTITNKNNYDVNYRLDIIENGNVSDNINYSYAINDENYSEPLSLKEYYTVMQNKVLRANKMDIYRIKIWLNETNRSFTADISLTVTKNEDKYATGIIKNLANKNMDSVIFDNTNYRYSKSDANNYIWFNCQDGYTKGDNYCYKWRIIGSFKNSTEKAINDEYMLKIVSSDIIENINYNNEERNGDYANSYIETFANGFYYDQLNNEAKEMIIKAKWNIGNAKSLNYQESLKEEALKTYYANIGLLSVSDYLYLKDSIFDNNILLLNKFDNDTVNVLNSEIIKKESTSLANFLPCAYLRPDVSIISGDGTFDNPYEIMIKYPMNY